MKSNKILITLIVFVVCVYSTFTQEIDIDSFNEKLETTEKAKQNQTLDINGKYQLIVGLGYQKLLWNYNTTTPSSVGGASQTINQGSEYNGLSVYTKFLAFRPFGLSTRLSFFIPFSIQETIYPTTSDSGVSVVTNSRFVLKNIPEERSKGVGVDVLIGPNYEFVQNNFSFNLGGGVGWVSFFEDIGYTDRATSMIGFGLDVDFQWHIRKFFGMSFGMRGEYYPFTIHDTNNKVTGDGSTYTLETKYMAAIGCYVATAWYF